MRRVLLILCVMLFCESIVAQTLIQNPDYISSNISGEVTKVEFTDNETILHFHVKSAIGSWIYIPSKTYIEDALGFEKRLYIKKAEGIDIDKEYTFSTSDEVRYKLYFPPLGKHVKKINYGESNRGGNWFIYKLDITKNGSRFLNSFNLSSLNNTFVIGHPLERGAEDKIFGMPHLKAEHHFNTTLPKDMPKTFFGNWCDKYETLILITTPDYLVLNSRIQYYQDIQKISNNKYVVKSTGGGFHVLNLDNETMTIRTDKLSTLKRVPSKNVVPKFLRGDWTHKNKTNKIIVSDEYLYNDDITENKKQRIDYVAQSSSGEVIWLIAYDGGHYEIYMARKIDGEYILSPRGHEDAQYQKVKT